MEIYLPVILLLSVFAFIEVFNFFKINLLSKLISFSLLLILIGFRWETGTDWDSYLNHFNSITDFSSAVSGDNGFEFGYNILIWVIKCVNTNYSFFIFCHTFIYLIILFKGLSYLSNSFFISLLLYFSITIGVLGSNRQLLALVIGIYSFKFIFQSQPKLFLISILLAMSFHFSAVLLFIFYFLNFKFEVWSIILILALSFCIGKFKLVLFPINYFAEYFGGINAMKAITYIEKTENLDAVDRLSIVGLVKRITFIFFFGYHRNFLSVKTPYYNLLFNAYLLGLVFYFLFADSFLIMINRGSLYFNVTEPILFALQLAIFEYRKEKLLYVLLVSILAVILFFQSISPYPDLFIPYKSIFYNTGYKRVLY